MQRAKLNWKDNGAPESELFGDHYFCEDGYDETHYVFLQQSGVLEKLAENPEKMTVAETGFGTGLNFLALLNVMKELNSKTKLDFFSVEKYPMLPDDLAKCHELWPFLREYFAELQSYWLALEKGLQSFSFFNDQVNLNLMIGDAEVELNQNKFKADYWFLDGFAPKLNPEMWTERLLELISQRSALGARFSTFTSVGYIKRALRKYGFEVNKAKGYGFKRDMLIGVKIN